MSTKREIREFLVARRGEVISPECLIAESNA